MSKARKKVFPKVVTRADFISRDTVQNHIRGRCDNCDHHASYHYSSSFKDCVVKRCHVSDCKCSDFKASEFRKFPESTKSKQDRRAILYSRDYLRSNNCAATAHKYSSQYRSTRVR